jgi:hypothetical protein
MPRIAGRLIAGWARSTTRDESGGGRSCHSRGEEAERDVHVETGSGCRMSDEQAFGMVGINGSGAYADIDSGVAVAMMRNRFDAGDLTTLAQIDRIVLDELS